jgi:shikimate dehydrogenase
MSPSPTRLAVIGHPIAHSRSPRIHAAFAQALGLAVDYQAVLAPLDGFADTVAQLRSQGFAGCNVTLPFKTVALALATQASPRAQLAGAANTLGFDGDRVWADNTDGLGLVADLQLAGHAVGGARLLLLGAGGASAGCLGPLIEARPNSIALYNRSADKAHALVARHAALAAQCGVPLMVLAQLDDPARRFDGVINGTSAALGGQALQLPTDLLAPGAWALDMVYGPAAQPFLHWAQAQGARTRDGLGMLVAQAAEAFSLWLGQRPDPAPVLAALRTELGP